MLSGLRDAATAKRLFRKALTESVASTAPHHQHGPGTPLRGGDFRSEAGRNPATPVAATGMIQYVNNILEQDHRAIKRRVKAKQGFREFHAARRTIQG